MFIQKGGDMTTITSHSLPLLPLRSNLSNLFGKRINDEPICPPSTKLIRLGASPKEDDDPLHRQQQMSPQDCYGSENSQSNNICDIIDRQSMNGMESSRFAISALTNDEMAISEPRSVNSMSSYKAEGMHNKDDDDDEMSYCSDDSELSVGKEVDDTISDKKTALFSHHHRIDDDSALHERNERLSMAAATTASRLQPKLPNIIRPSPTRQEEFLRKSHFYAEEIMKHQLNFMTVTKGLNISPKLSDNTFNYPVRPNALAPIHSAAINSPLKIGLSRLQAYANDNDLSKKWSVIDDRSSRSPEGTNFREIHSHLNAISKITSALGRDTCNRVQMTSPDSNASRENSQSPPTPHLQHFHHMLHNNFNETNLKFSIDNILKPSFGRRITDPLLKRNKTQRKNASQQRGAPPSINDGVAGKTTAIDSTTSTLISAGCKTPLSPPDQTVTKLSIPSPTSVSATGEQVDKSNASATAPASTAKSSNNNNSSIAWPAWVYCTRYSDRPSSGPRARRPKKPTADKAANDEKRPRTAFSGPQLARLKNEFAENRYLTERRRQQLSNELGLNEAQIKIWFQNKRAKIKKSSGQKNPLALQLMAQGLYNHSTVPLTREEEELQEMQERANAEAAAAAADDDDDD